MPQGEQVKAGSLVQRKLDSAIYIVTKIYRNHHGGLRVDIRSQVHGHWHLKAIRPSNLRVLSR